MDKELESITQVTTVGDLRSKLVEAEEAKVEVEAILLERVSSEGRRRCDNHFFYDKFQNQWPTERPPARNN